MRKVNYKECPICKNQIGAPGYSQHVKVCNGTGLLGAKISTDPKLANGKTQAWYDSMAIRKTSNQYLKAGELGLPKPQMPTESKSRISEKAHQRKHSAETKKKLSEYRKKYLEEHPEKAPYLLNHYSKGPSYPEIYWIDLIRKENLDLSYHKQIGLYELDFFNEDKKIDLEIDGEQHYSDNRIVESDQRRTLYLESLGWKIIRVRWSEWQKKTAEEKHYFVEELRDIMNRR